MVQSIYQRWMYCSKVRVCYMEWANGTKLSDVRYRYLYTLIVPVKTFIVHGTYLLYVILKLARSCSIKYHVINCFGSLVFSIEVLT